MDFPKTVFLNPWDQRIGPNRYLAELLFHDRRLAASSVVVLPEEGEAAQEYSSLGCQVQVWPEAALLHPRLALKRLPQLLAQHSLGLRRMCRRLAALETEILVSNAENLCVGGLASRLLKIPHLQIFHGLALAYHWGSWPRVVRAYLRLLAATSDTFITVSPAVTSMLEDYGIAEQQIRCIPNGLSVERLTEASARPLPDHVTDLTRGRRPIVTSFGRIASVKGYDVLIDALPAVRDRYPDLVCLIAGQPLSEKGVGDATSYGEMLRARVRQLKLESHVFFLGEIDYGPSLLRAVDIYVQASRTESFCRSVAEASICGAPVVATAVGGLPRVLGEDGGLLVPPDNPEELGAAMLRLLEDPELGAALASTGRAHIIEKFNAAHLVKDFCDLLIAASNNGEMGSGGS